MTVVNQMVLRMKGCAMMSLRENAPANQLVIGPSASDFHPGLRDSRSTYRPTWKDAVG